VALSADELDGTLPGNDSGGPEHFERSERPIAGGARPAEAVERAADELYRLPLADFTRARDELARRLRQEGLRDEAAAVKALRKPTLAAWALNQLARRRRHEVERLLATGKRLREAQEALLAGGDRSALQRASAEERELVAELTRNATALAGEVGRSATGSLEERIRATLHAAALDEQAAAELAAGRLVREREAVGLFGVTSAEAKSAGKARPAEKPARPAVKSAGASGKRGRDGSALRKVAERRRELGRELAAARAEEQKAERLRARAAKAAERAGRHAKDAQRRAEGAQKRAGEARARLREAERRERDAAIAYDRASRAVAAAERKLE
jgi:hypothetical protein